MAKEDKTDSGTATQAEYDELMKDRPEKFDEAESGYRDYSNHNEQCRNCIHLFRRVRDGYRVCEIVRPTQGTEEITLHYTCKFHTTDGDTFSFLE